METTDLFDLAVRETRPLGAGTRARRAAMREDLLRAVDRRRLRRRSTRGLAGALILALGLLVTRPLLRTGAVDAPGDLPDAGSGIAILVVQDEPTVTDRMSAPVTPAIRIATVRSRPIDPAVLLDDRGLSHWLRSARKPSWVVRAGGRVLVDESATE